MRSGNSGTNTFRFTRRIGGKRLGPGSYRLVAMPKANGRSGRAVSVTFRVIKWTLSGYFSILKRGVNGTYHRISPAHLHRYLNEFDFRYSSRHQSDGARTVAALSQAEGKRLKYRETR